VAVPLAYAERLFIFAFAAPYLERGNNLNLTRAALLLAAFLYQRLALLSSSAADVL
jgi:hypothetical protein